MTVSIEQAQRQLAQLLDKVAAGEEMVITRDGRAVARLIPEGAGGGGSPNGTKRPDRVPGSAKGLIISIAPDFDEPLEDFREYMS